jgi:hypothetical protein
MRVLFGVLAYLLVAVAGVGGAAAFVFFAFWPAAEMVAAQETSKAAPRIQAWQDRKAEELHYAEKQRAAALAEKEEAEKSRLRHMTTQAPPVIARTSQDEAESEREAVRGARHRDARARERAQDARRRTDGSAAEARWSSSPVRLHGPE